MKKGGVRVAPYRYITACGAEHLDEEHYTICMVLLQGTSEKSSCVDNCLIKEMGIDILVYAEQLKRTTP
jgi:hypothetical protein